MVIVRDTTPWTTISQPGAGNTAQCDCKVSVETGESKLGSRTGLG